MIILTRNDSIYKGLASITSEQNIQVNQPLKERTYTHLGGTADFFVTPETYKEVQNIVIYTKEIGIPFTLLGNGSNLIIKDGGIRGVVLNLAKLNELRLEGNSVIAQSGARIIDASRFARTHELTGLEFACGIPGSVGGALFMNAGAYGGEVKDCLLSAKVIDRDGKLLDLSASALNLSYRTSNIPDNGYIVLEATFGLVPGELPSIQAMMDDLTEKRETKQPLEYPSCGSVFKRPEGYFAGKLIQDSDLQGFSIGGAQVSMKHAGFIVNRDNATAEEYIGLIRHVQKTVKEKFDVHLEREVRIIGED